MHNQLVQVHSWVFKGTELIYVNPDISQEAVVQERRSKMYLPLIVISSLVIFTCQVSSEINSYENSDQQLWPLVYTLYPFYNSETLLEIWRTAKTVDISTDVTLAPNDQEQTVLYTNDVHNNDTNLNSQNNLSYFVNEVKNINEEQLSKTRQRLSNYRNRHRDTNVRNE